MCNSGMDFWFISNVITEQFFIQSTHIVRVAIAELLEDKDFFFKAMAA